MNIVDSRIESGCYCPSDCNCKSEYRMAVCGCNGTHREERDCYHPRSCNRCNYLGEPCGSHHVGQVGHERCTGQVVSEDENS